MVLSFLLRSDGLGRILHGRDELRLLVDGVLLVIELRRSHVGVLARGLHHLRIGLILHVVVLVVIEGLLRWGGVRGGGQVEHHLELLSAFHDDTADTQADADEAAEDD